MVGGGPRVRPVLLDLDLKGLFTFAFCTFPIPRHDVLNRDVCSQCRRVASMINERLL